MAYYGTKNDMVVPRRLYIGAHMPELRSLDVNECLTASDGGRPKATC